MSIILILLFIIVSVCFWARLLIELDREEKRAETKRKDVKRDRLSDEEIARFRGYQELLCRVKLHAPISQYHTVAPSSRENYVWYDDTDEYGRPLI